MRPGIAIFDYRVVSTNPIGSCHLRMIRNLCNEFDFTVFSVEFENPCPERVRWVRIPAPLRPMALLYVAFHVLAPLYYLYGRLLRGYRFDVVQMVESNLVFGQISYSQFCHRAYLRDHWSHGKAGGLRGWLRWADHWLHSLVEPSVFNRVGRIVVPSRGLAGELQAAYPEAQGKIEIISNPVESQKMKRPEGFDRNAFRAKQGFTPDHTVLLFIALGHFERKGLPMLLEAMQKLNDRTLRLVVVGGTPDLVEKYEDKTAGMGLKGKVIYTGMQKDLREFFWASDCFVFPSFYETFSLVSYEAAAAGLPVIATPLHGVEEFLRDGVNGFLIERSTEGVMRGLQRFLDLPVAARQEMGLTAQTMVREYDVENFSRKWRSFYLAEGWKKLG